MQWRRCLPLNETRWAWWPSAATESCRSSAWTGWRPGRPSFPRRAHGVSGARVPNVSLCPHYCITFTLWWMTAAFALLLTCWRAASLAIAPRWASPWTCCPASVAARAHPHRYQLHRHFAPPHRHCPGQRRQRCRAWVGAPRSPPAHGSAHASRAACAPAGPHGRSPPNPPPRWRTATAGAWTACAPPPPLPHPPPPHPSAAVHPPRPRPPDPTADAYDGGGMTKASSGRGQRVAAPSRERPAMQCPRGPYDQQR
mmetsp:Transcript_27937/g.90159  ORF Transcript_27937/g.90159 Transcript_27937/m.90159 type:complete len:255 (+) Transcript_27937:139-903(+)